MSWDSICREIEAEPILSPVEERALWQAWKDGDERARRKLIACSLRFALGPAKAAARPGQRWEPGDLLGEATKALAGCVERWDGSGSFAGYAGQRIRGTIKDFLRRKADVMRTPAGSERALSLDAPQDEDRPAMLDRQQTETETIDAADLPTLTRREMQVLELTILLQPCPGCPDAAAEALGLSPDAVRRLLRSALRKSTAEASGPRQAQHGHRALLTPCTPPSITPFQA
jgi:RNA polymerase sigma factor (sigma-70 family)